MTMKEKKLMVMTSFGPVPFDVVKEYLPKEVVEVIESKKDMILSAFENPVPMGVGYYVESLAKKTGWKPEKMANYLQNLWNINPAATFSILLKEVAIELDKKYEDHINNCKEFFVISTMDGRIYKTHRAGVKNFRNFAAFRTEEDAKTACRVLKTYLKDLFKSGRKQEDQKC